MNSSASTVACFGLALARRNAFRHFAAALSLALLVTAPQIFAAGSVAPGPGSGHTVKLLTQRGYLPAVPVLVRVELRSAAGQPDRAVWDIDAMLSADGGVTISTNRVLLRNGLGSALVTFSGGGDFTLTATVAGISTTHALLTLTNAPVTTVGGTLPAGTTTWSGVILATNSVTVPVGGTLTILSNTLVQFSGAGGATNNLIVNGTIQALGVEDQPVTLTCANAGQRWGQIRHNTAQPSLYRFTSITRAGRGTGEGHTGTTPVIRPTNSKMTFESCSITDLAETQRGAAGFGTPGKIGSGTGSDLTFIDCLFQRARMGPEISGTALLCTNTWMMDMNGPDDSDGIYIHDQSAGQQVLLTGCVLARGDDDGIDTLGSIISVEDCIVRDWDNLLEDAKGISALNGAVNVRRSLIVNSTVGIAAKSGGSTPSTTSVRVSVVHCTMTGNLTNVLANRKSSAVGPNVHLSITNSILLGVNSVHSDFEPASSDSTNFTVRYCDLSEPYPGAGNIQAVPMFANAALHDYRLLPFSPAIDAGHPLSPGDADGSPADMGALVFCPPAPQLAAPQWPGGAFQFELSAYTNRNWKIESSTNGTTWNLLQTVFPLSTPMVVGDASATNHPHRFYRARLAP